MCDRKFIRTTMQRATLTQEIQKLLGKEPSGLHRVVQIVIPPAPTVYIDIDMLEGETGDVMTNKTFNMPVVHPGQFVKFSLGPEQQLFGASHEGFALVTLVIEYYAEAKP